MARRETATYTVIAKNPGLKPLGFHRSRGVYCG
jgi:hypothetical protein